MWNIQIYSRQLGLHSGAQVYSLFSLCNEALSSWAKRQSSLNAGPVGSRPNPSGGGLLRSDGNISASVFPSTTCLTHKSIHQQHLLREKWSNEHTTSREVFAWEIVQMRFKTLNVLASAWKRSATEGPSGVGAFRKYATNSSCFQCNASSGCQAPSIKKNEERLRWEPWTHSTPEQF